MSDANLVVYYEAYRCLLTDGIARPEKNYPLIIGDESQVLHLWQWVAS